MRRLQGLDALRGVAALFVAIHHLIRAQLAPSPIAPGMAVDLFFILSGFVMARTYEARMREGLTTIRFLGIRYRRLFLPLAIGSTIGLALVALRSGVTPEDGAAYVLILGFMPSFWLANCFFINIPAWSLFLEILANALHGLVLGRLSGPTLRWLWIAAALAFTATFVTGHAQWGLDIWSILWLIPRELSCYIMGILLFRTYGDKPLGNIPLAAVAALPALLVAAHFDVRIELPATLFIAPLIVRGSLGLNNANWATMAGAMSYPLYATHLPVIELSYWFGLNPAVAFVFALLVAAALANVPSVYSGRDRIAKSPCVKAGGN